MSMSRTAHGMSKLGDDWREQLNDWVYAHSVLDRLTSGSRIDNDCWVWQRSRTADGYGQISVKKQMIRTHQVSYHLFIGRVPDGLQLDHLCRNRACCNPWHLEPVTAAENIRRGLAPDVLRTFQSSKTHCAMGHEYSAENTYFRQRNGSTTRTCKKCRADGMASSLRARSPEQRQAFLAKRREQAKARAQRRLT